MTDIVPATAVDYTLLPSAARTATVTSADLSNVNSRGIKVTIDVTAVTTSTLTVAIKYKDPASGKYVSMLASTGLIGTGTTTLTIYPGMTASSNAVASDVLPATFQIVATKGDSSSWTYSIGYTLLA